MIHRLLDVRLISKDHCGSAEEREREEGTDFLQLFTSKSLTPNDFLFILLAEEIDVLPRSPRPFNNRKSIFLALTLPPRHWISSFSRDVYANGIAWNHC